MVKNSLAMQGFNPWVRKIPWKREWLTIPVFLSEEFHAQRSLVGCSPCGSKELDMTEQLTLSLFLLFPGVLQSMGSQRAEHDWVTELNWICTKSLHISYFIFLNSSFPSEKHPLGLLQGMVCQAQNVWHAQFLWLFPSSKETAAAFSRSGWFLFYTYPTAGVGSGIGVLLVPHLWFLRDHSVV